MKNTTDRYSDGTEPAKHRLLPQRVRGLASPAGHATNRPRAGKGILVFSRYADVSAVVRDPAFASKDADWFAAHLPGWRQSAGMRLFGTSMLFHNGASHQRLRKVLLPAFSPARLRSLRETVRAVTERRLDLLLGQPRGEVVDLHALFTFPVTSATGCALIGVPEEDGPLLHEWVQPLLGLLDPEVGPRTLAGANRAAGELRPYIDKLVAERRARPQDDLASLVAVALDDDEAASALALTLAAGFDTTVTLLDHALSALMRSPASASVASGEPACVDAAVSEALRLASPVQLITRVAQREVSVGEVQVRPGQEVMALIADAHRDPEYFPDPETFELHRPASRLLSFGGGAHYCLGAQLARLEASVVLPALLRRVPRMAPAGSPRPNDRVTMHGWTDLPVVLGP
ncbi:cytochrome P450 [Streptomyces sp. NPDC051582]|uniref:cytochrome P450 n=1 Tax=Streptomyces sp. NPDC051582 TaxID=3155167 RepID=UPI00344A2824